VLSRGGGWGVVFLGEGDEGEDKGKEEKSNPG